MDNFDIKNIYEPKWYDSTKPSTSADGCKPNKKHKKSSL